MRIKEDDLFLPFGADGVDEDGFVDLDAAIPNYGDSTSEDFVDDDRDFEDVDDLEELLAEDREADSRIADSELIPDEDLSAGEDGEEEDEDEDGEFEDDEILEEVDDLP